MNPLRTLLNRYLHTVGLSNLVLQVDTHSGPLTTVVGSQILTVNPQGFCMSEAEIPYHRVRTVHDGGVQVYP